MSWIIPISILILFELIADVLAKEWSMHGLAIRWIGALAAYLLGNMFWLFALKNGSGLARGAIIFSVVSAILATVIGIIFYREELTTTQIAGIIVGIVSIVLIFWNS
jgi:glucose uptake protein GlcU